MEFDRNWRLLVGGEFRSTAETFEVTDPATGARIATAPAATAANAEAAIDAAQAGLDEWQSLPVQERIDTLHDVADAIDAHRDELVELEVRENGKPVSQAKSDVEKAVRRVQYYAGAADKFTGTTLEYSETDVKQAAFEPYGVVGVIIPWNWPLVHSIDFAAAALAAGNTAVVKPAPETPLCSLRIAEIVSEVLPDGAYNVVSGGTEPSQAIAGSADVDKLAFTGSDETAERVLAAAAKHITPAKLELGGKNPALVFPEADLDATVAGLLGGITANCGQACAGIERLLVHKSVYDEVLTDLRAAVRAVSIGPGMDDPDVGPIVSDDHAKVVQGFVDRAVAEGAEIAAQATVPSNLPGDNWIAPTVLTDVSPGMEIAREEVFGPVVAVLPFEDESEAVALANDTKYGLSASIWTTGLARANRVASRIEAGQIGINSAFGGSFGLPSGGYKRSGIGRKNDFSETMREFLQAKSIHTDLTVGE